MENRSAHYSQLTNRNIGLLTPDQQKVLQKSRVAICGLGGIGSPVAEMLCRLGIEHLNLLDNGTFEPTNLNRQIYSFTDTNDRLKTDVTGEFLMKINPACVVNKFEFISVDNVAAFLEDIDLIVLGIDSVKPCLIISREARKRGVPIVEGWAVVAGNVRVFTNNTPDLEEVYQMPTIGRSIDSITPEEEKQLLIHTLEIVQQQIPGLGSLYPETAMRRMVEKNEGTTLGPLVWLTCSLMAIECMKVLLAWGELALAPKFATYNPIVHQKMNTLD